MELLILIILLLLALPAAPMQDFGVPDPVDGDIISPEELERRDRRRREREGEQQQTGGSPTPPPLPEEPPQQEDDREAASQIRGEDEHRLLSTERDAEEIRFQKQCFLAYNMLQIREKAMETIQQENEARFQASLSGFDDDPTDPLPAGIQETMTLPHWHNVIYGGAASDITSLIASSPQVQELLDLKPYLLSYFVPYLRIYKVMGATDEELISAGLEADQINQLQLPPPGTEIEFKFQNSLDEAALTEISQITEGGRARAGGVGLKSFSWEYLGVNPAEVENNIKAGLSLHFNSIKDFEEKHISSAGGEDYQYRFSDLVVPEPLYHTNSESPLYNEHQRAFNVNHFRIKVVAGWTVPDGAALEEMVGSASPDHVDLRKVKETIRQTKKVLYLNLIAHSINFNDDGSMDLDAHYQAYIEGSFTSPQSDILNVPDLTDRTTNLAARLELINEDIRRMNRVDSNAENGGCDEVKIGGPAMVDGDVIAETAQVFAPNSSNPQPYVLTVTHSANRIRHLRTIMEEVHTNTVERLTFHRRQNRTRAYRNLMRQMVRTSHMWTIQVPMESLGFQSISFDESQEAGDIAPGTRRFEREARESRGGPSPGSAEAAEERAARERRLAQGASEVRGQAVRQGTYRAARDQVEQDLDVVRRQAALGRFYRSADFTVDFSLQRFNLFGGLRACQLPGPLSEYLDETASATFSPDNAEDREEREAELLENVRRYVYLGYLTDEQRAADRLTNRADAAGRVHQIPIDFMFFGDLLDTVFSKGAGRWLRSQNIEVFLGTFQYSDPKMFTGEGAGEIEYAAYPLAWIPISVDSYQVWFLDEVIAKGRTTMTIQEFIRSVSDKLLVNAFGSECMFDPSGRFTLAQERLSIIPEFYTIPTQKLVMAGMHGSGIFNRQRRGNTINYEHVRANVRDPEHPIRLLDDEPGNSFEDYKSVVLYQSQTSSENIGDLFDQDLKEMGYLEVRELDKQRGIHHLNIGSDRGLVKAIRFSRMDQDYMIEARMSAAGELGSFQQLRERYNSTISMFGNMFFYPGQYIFINPSMVGTNAVMDIDSLTTKLGLGGYFLITKVENIIERGNFETILQCSWVYSGFSHPSRSTELAGCNNDQLQIPATRYFGAAGDGLSDPQDWLTWDGE